MDINAATAEDLTADHGTTAFAFTAGDAHIASGKGGLGRRNPPIRYRRQRPALILVQIGRERFP